MSEPRHMVMVHGAFCGAWAFDGFTEAFERQGFTVHALDLPGHGEDEPREAAAGASMTDYAARVASFCHALPTPPVLLGHSLGGLVSLMAASRAPVAALVLIAPSGPWGIAGFSMEEAVTAFGIQTLNPFAGTVEPDADIFARFSLDRIPVGERARLLAKLRPESARALRETLAWWLDPFMTTAAGSIDAPALVLVGGEDRVHPAATVRQTAQRIGAEVQVLPGASHWPFLEPGWEGLVARISDWLEQRARAAA